MMKRFVSICRLLNLEPIKSSHTLLFTFIAFLTLYTRLTITIANMLTKIILIISQIKDKELLQIERYGHVIKGVFVVVKNAPFFNEKKINCIC